MKNRQASIIVIFALYLMLLVFFPLLATAFMIPLSVIFAKNKRRVVISALVIGVFFGLMAYIFIPDAGYDLVAHHREVSEYSKVSSIDDYIKVSKINTLEPIPQFISYAISRMGNSNLLQALVVFVGFSSIAYITLDNMLRIKISPARKLLYLACVLLAQSLLYFFSGLYNYLAICIFALGYYIENIKKHKYSGAILYLLAILTHISILLRRL